jgi:integrase
MSDGYFFKRCGCRDPQTGKLYKGSSCPKLRRRGGTWSADHGTWAYQLELPRTADRRRRLLRRGGFATQRDAQTERDHARALLDLATRDQAVRARIADQLTADLHAGKALPEVDTMRRRINAGTNLAESPTLAEYLTGWLADLEKTAGLAGATITAYESHIRVHLIPHLGHLRIDELRPRHIRAMFAAITDHNQQIAEAHASADPAVRATVCGVRQTSAATRHRIRATLRNALNHAIADELLTINAAAHVKTPEHRGRPIVWTAERVAAWKTTGEIPGPVMVWTIDQTIEFLRYTAAHAPDLYPMLHLIAYRGLRRGEACGLKEADVQLDNRTAAITNQITAGRNGLVHKPPKSHAGKRQLFYDDDTHRILATYHASKTVNRLRSVAAWPDTGLFFVQPDGQPWDPNAVSQHFRRLIKNAGLPPIRLHDLRHVAATIALHAGIDIKILQEQLGHTTSTLTRDTYQSVLEQAHRQAANAVADALNPHGARRDVSTAFSADHAA